MATPLTGTALARARDLAKGYVDDHQVLVYLGPRRGDLDESAITAGWLPGVGWEHVSGQVLLSAGITLDVGERGTEIGLTVAEEARSVWYDDRALAIVARHWFPGVGWGGWYCAAWGYLPGNGEPRHRAGVGQESRRTATYGGYWGRMRLPSHRLGRRNLANGASIAASSPALATPQAEAPLEYLAQDDCAATKAIDQFADTTYVADVIADPAIPTIGETYVPKFLRVGGPHQRGIAAGGQARFVELWAGYDLLRGDTDNPAAYAWGTFASPGSTPPPEGNASAIINNDFLETFFDGNRYVVHAKQQGSNPNNSVYVQWNTSAPALWHGVPAILSFKIRARGAGDIGNGVVLQWGHSGTNHNVFITLAAAEQQFNVPIDALASTGSLAGGLVMRFRAAREELYVGDITWELWDLHLWTGYNGPNYTQQEGKALFLACDDGAGNERLVRLANLVNGDGLNPGEEIVIPPRDSIVIVDDRATFERQFGSTGKTILQMKSEYRQWFFAPGVGRMKLCWGNDPNRFDYDDASMTGPVVNSAQLPAEEILFSVANGGTPWRSDQSLSRQNPVGTGFLLTEDFAHLGLIPPYGAAYVWIDLGAYVAPKLVAALPNTGAGSDRAYVDDIDAYGERGLATLPSGERIRWTAKGEDYLAIENRGWGGTTIATHPAGQSLTPDSYNGVNQGLGLPQTGHNLDLIELRRKPGTPRIVAGAILVSNLVAPTNPSEGGARWENNPDWTAVMRWTGNTSLDVITANLLNLFGRPIEARHICVVGDEMARVNGMAQRFKLNEVVAREWQASGGGAGGWKGHGVADVGGALAHILTQHAKVPSSKVIVQSQSPAIGDLTVAPTMVASALDTLANNDGFRVRLDRVNTAYVEPTNVNPVFTAPAPFWVWTPDLLASEEVTARWAERSRSAQTRIAARDVAAMRDHSAQYPAIPRELGQIVELRDVRVLTAADAFGRAVREDRQANTRRAMPIEAGALPWLEVGQRHLLALTDLDIEGGFVGVNVVVDSYKITIGADDGGVTWATSIQVREMALG